MGNYVEQIKKRYPKLFYTETFDTKEFTLEGLYWHYFEEHPIDTEEIKKRFAELAGILDQLTLKEHDRVWDLACALCTEHEKVGFLEGARMGAALVAELLGEIP